MHHNKHSIYMDTEVFGIVARPANSVVWPFQHTKNGHSAQAVIPFSGHTDCITLCILSHPPLSRDSVYLVL